LTTRVEKQQQVLGADGVVGSEKGFWVLADEDGRRKRLWVLADRLGGKHATSARSAGCGQVH
jgi:hypothetical protein